MTEQKIIRRRVVNGKTFILTKKGKWRLIANGMMLTKKGWKPLLSKSRPKTLNGPPIIDKMKADKAKEDEAKAIDDWLL